jgi:cobalt-zinc-cadmium efflux system outer membrane protein
MARQVGADLVLPSNPVVSFSAGPRRENSASEHSRGIAYAGHIEQTLEIAGQRSTRRAEVDKAVHAATAREGLARAEIHARVRAVYVGAQLAEAQIRSARHRVELASKLVDSIRVRVESGAASDVDLQLARVERGWAVREQTTADLLKTSALCDLRILLGASSQAPLDVQPTLDRPASLVALPLMLERARTRRSELKVLEASREATSASIVRLHREAIPSPTLFVDLARDLPGQLYVGGGIALPIPVWRRNQGEIALARAEHDRLEVETRLAEHEIEGEVERAYHAAAANREIVEAMEREILPAAESAADLVTQGWRAGKFDLFRVIQASREVSEARRKYLESLAVLWEATIEVERAAGAL